VTQAASEIISTFDEQETFNMSDKGNGGRFAVRYRGTARYVVDVDQWVVWNGNHWELDPGRLKTFGLTAGVIEDIRQWADTQSNDVPDGQRESPRERWAKWALRSESTPARKAMLVDAASRTGMFLTEEQFDRSFDDLVTPAGTVNLVTNELRPSDPADLNLRCTNVPYVQEAAERNYSKELELFLETFLPDEDDQRFVFAVLGRTLRAGNRTRVFPIIYGGTTSGKSQLMAAVHKVLGSYVCAIGSSVFRGNQDDKPRPDIVKAMYTRLAYATEASKSWALHADQIKRLTGNDALPYRNHYGQLLNAYPRFTPLLVTNEFPRITNIDWPTKRRTLVIHFDRSLEVKEEDPAIKQRFLSDPRCLEAVLARMVAGSRDPITEDVENIPARYVLATMNAYGAMDHVDDFLTWMKAEDYLTECSLTAPVSSCAKKSDLHKWYVAWVKQYGDKADKQDSMGLKEFNTKLEERGWKDGRSAGYRWLGHVLTTPAGVFGIQV
jgi:P4 family phage/plasmid primase-like protien